MKRGVTVSILVVTVTLMLVIVSTATVIGTGAIQTASYEEFLSKVSRVANDVNEYYIKNKQLPTTSEIISKEGLPTELVAELNKNNDTTNNLFVVDMTKLRTESVNIGTGTVEDMDVFVVAENTNNVYYLKGVEYKGTTYYGVQLTETISNTTPNIPEAWRTNVVDIVDTVPIPKGFVASPYAGENTKNGGLVIYQLNENETAIPSDETQYKSWTTRNQYVWVPVDKEEFTTKFVRKNYSNGSGDTSNTLGSGWWEVEVDQNNIPLATQSDMAYMSEDTFAEVQAMYSSVKEYGGFYIARYEAGIDARRAEKGVAADLPRGIDSVYSIMNKIPYTYIPWTWNNAINEDTNGAVEVARSVYTQGDTKFGVVSTLTYGVQWDRTLAWWIESGAKDIAGNIISVTNSISYGNYVGHVISSENELNQGAIIWNYATSSANYVPKTDTTLKYPRETESWVLSTGALKVSKINNIYDMAGNVYEWIMEGASTTNRAARGGQVTNTSSDYNVGIRYTLSPDTVSSRGGFRVSLYIKK